MAGHYSLGLGPTGTGILDWDWTTGTGVFVPYFRTCCLYGFLKYFDIFLNNHRTILQSTAIQ